MNTEGQKTPKWLFDKAEAIVEQITGRTFDLDGAASPWNAQCPIYFTREQNSLKQEWTDYRNIFLNPPFDTGEIQPFIWKAIEASKAGCTVAILVPVWTSYEWCVQLKTFGQYHDIVGLVFFELFDGKRIVRNKGDKQIQLAIIGPNVKPGNGPAIYAPMPPKKERLDPAVTNGEPNGESTVQPDGQQPSVKRRRGPRMLLGSQVRRKATEWFWYPRIPLGELSMLDGDPGKNKSSITIDLTARATSGAQMPDGGQGVDGGVVLCLAEDSWEKTVRPRLDAAGADLDRVLFVENLMIPRDRKSLAEAVARIKAKLVVIDPMNAFLTADANSDQKVHKPSRRFVGWRTNSTSPCSWSGTSSNEADETPCTWASGQLASLRLPAPGCSLVVAPTMKTCGCCATTRPTSAPMHVRCSTSRSTRTASCGSNGEGNATSRPTT